MAKSNSEPIYVSPPAARTYWQEYRIYPDRLELDSRLALHTLIVPANEILGVEVRPSLVVGDWLFRGRGFRYAFAFKLDLADLHTHVAIHRVSGFMKHLRFTPDDPDRFVEKCKTIVNGDS